MVRGAIIQARMTSTRLPGKVLLDLEGRPVLQRVIERVKECKMLDEVIVATTTNETDDPIEELCNKLGCKVYRGSEQDVLLRVLEAARKFEVDIVVEITADCPLIDWNHLSTLLKLHGSGKGSDITSNIGERTFPRGYDVRVFNTDILERANEEVDNPIDRQHVSTWFYLNPKTVGKYIPLNWVAPNSQRRPDLEVTLDTPEDYELIKWIYAAGKDYSLDLTCEEVINLLDVYPYIYEKVAKIERKDYLSELNDYYSQKELNKDESTDNRSGKPRSSSGRNRFAK